MSVTLPQKVNYADAHPSLPEGVTTTSMTLSAINGQTFTSGSLIQFDFTNRGFIVPDSIYIRYKIQVTNATTASSMIGCPVYTPFLRLETLLGSQVVESINQYNQVQHVLSNLTLDVASKYGLQSAFGYNDNTTAGITMEKLDGRAIALAGETFFMSAPVNCILSNADKLIPAFCMPQIRLQFTLDSFANMFTTNTPSAVTLTNVELCYTMVDMGSGVEDMVRSMGEKIYIKSQSFTNSASTIATGSLGATELVFNQRLASIKSAFVNLSGTSSASANKWGDSYDITSNNGDYQLNVGGIVYPQRALSTLMNKAGILQELRNATGSIYDKNNSFSINSVEWNRVGNDTSTADTPAKFYLGFCLEKIHSNAILTGISSQNSAITFRVNTSTATAQAHTINLILNYDALIEVDTVNKQCSVKQ